MEIKTLAKNTAILASPKVLKFFVGIIRAKLIAVFLGAKGAGIINQLSDTITQIQYFTLTDLPDGMVKIIAQENSIKFDREKIAMIIKTYFIMVIPLTILVTFLGYFFTNEITVYIFGDIQYKLYFQIGFSALPITILSTTFRALLKAFKEIKSFAIAEFIVIIVNLLLFIPLIYYYKITGGVIYVTLSFITNFIVIFSLAKKNVLRKNNITLAAIFNSIISKKYFKELLAFISVGILGGSYYVFAEITIRAIVVNELGIDKLGVYSPITSWAGLFSGFILPSIYTYLYPRLSEAKNDKEIVDLINDVIRLITFLTIPFVILGISTREWIIPLFYSKEFLEAAKYLPYHFSALLLIIWSSIFSQLFYPTGRLRAHLIFVLIVNSLSLTFVYFLVPNIGLYGYLIKFTIVPLITVVMHILFWRQKINFSFKKENINIILYAISCSVILLLLKDKVFFLQIVSVILLFTLYFLLKKDEKDFIMKKIKETYNKIFK